MQSRTYYVYILASLSGTLYVGITSDLSKRMWQHKEHVYKGFTSTYQVDRLLYYETFSAVQDAIEREKQLKGWRRKKKINLITKEYPKWLDLSGGWFVDVPREFAHHQPGQRR
jgi:putative endonuclease